MLLIFHSTDKVREHAALDIKGGERRLGSCSTYLQLQHLLPFQCSMLTWAMTRLAQRRT